MTVINDIKTILAGLKGAQASFETFALSTDNQQAKQLYQDAAKKTQSIVDSIEPRVQEIEQEEPQYKEDNKKGDKRLVEFTNLLFLKIIDMTQR